MYVHTIIQSRDTCFRVICTVVYNTRVQCVNTFDRRYCLRSNTIYNIHKKLVRKTFFSLVQPEHTLAQVDGALVTSSSAYVVRVCVQEKKKRNFVIAKITRENRPRGEQKIYAYNITYTATLFYTVICDLFAFLTYYIICKIVRFFFF